MENESQVRVVIVTGAGEAYLRALGVTHVRCWADDEPPSLSFGERHGYRTGRTGHFNHLDLTGPLPAVPPLPPGVELRTAGDYLADPRPVYRLFHEASQDEPGHLTWDALGYQEWYDTSWTRPDLDHGLSTVAVVDGEPAALTFAQTDGATRYWSAGTDTRPAHRRRGLAKLVKAASLHRARSAGLTDAYTANDSTNAPMLAVNSRLGYRCCADERELLKELRSGSPAVSG